MNSLLDFLCENVSKSHSRLDYWKGIRKGRHWRQSSTLRLSMKRKTYRLTLEEWWRRKQRRVGGVWRETPISVRFEAGIGGSREHNGDRCGAFSTSQSSPHYIRLEEEPAEPTVSLIEVRSDDSPETHYWGDDSSSKSIREPTLTPKETPEIAVATQPEEVVTKVDAADDRETIVNYQQLRHLWTKCLLTKRNLRLLLRSERW